MDNTKIKSNVLQQLIDMMDEKMVGDLKSRSPKFAAQEPDDQEAAQQEDKFEDPSKESDMSDIKMDMAEGEDPFADKKDQEDPSNDEDMQRLLEMYKQIK